MAFNSEIEADLDTKESEARWSAAVTRTIGAVSLSGSVLIAGVSVMDRDITPAMGTLVGLMAAYGTLGLYSARIYNSEAANLQSLRLQQSQEK